MNLWFYPGHFTLDPRHSILNPRHFTIDPRQKPTLVRFLNKYFLMLKLIKTSYVVGNFIICCARKVRASVHRPELSE